jgi:hypothetical protein
MPSFTHPKSKKTIHGRALCAGEELKGTDLCVPEGSDDWKTFKKAEGIIIGSRCRTEWIRLTDG